MKIIIAPDSYKESLSAEEVANQIEAGFREVRSRAILSIPSSGRLTRRIDLALGLLSLGAQYYVRAVA